MKKPGAFMLSAVLGLASPMLAQSDASCPARPATLKAMRNCYRPVLVFAPGPHDRSFAAQQALLEQYADDMMDRDLLYVPVLVKSSGFARPLDAPYVLLKQAEVNAVRARFEVAAGDFAVVLVGKDGGEKFRSRRPVSVLQLDALVDAMPMGQQEKSRRTQSVR